MSAPQRIGLITSWMLTRCPHCKAAPLTPCHNSGRELRYTHLERNR